MDGTVHQRRAVERRRRVMGREEPCWEAFIVLSLLLGTVLVWLMLYFYRSVGNGVTANDGEHPRTYTLDLIK